MWIKKRYLCILMLILLTTVFLTVCQSKKETSKLMEEQTEDNIEIGMSFDTFVVERWQRDRDVFVSTANELGAEVNVQNANGDVEKQIEQLQYFIDKKVDVIVVVPIDANSLGPIIEKAKDKNIKIVSYDRLVNNANADLYISFDNEAVGHIMGSTLEKELTVKDNVLMICGPLTDGNVAMVNKGFEEEMEKSGINILDREYIDDWKAELAYDYVNGNMDTIKNQVQAIMCGNDNLASQVIVALSENRLAGDIIVTGQDADLDACQRIVEGTQFMTVFKPVTLLAEKAAILSVDLANGKEIPHEKTINDGTYDIPYISWSPVAVTKENMDVVIVDSGFHLKEDIYINRPQNLNQ